MVFLKKLEEEGDVNLERFYRETRNFYDKCLSYLGLYDGVYKDLNSHCWLDLKAEISWAKVLEFANKINVMFRKQMIDSDSLFDEEVLYQSLFPNVARKIAGTKHLLNRSGFRYSRKLKKRQ